MADSSEAGRKIKSKGRGHRMETEDSSDDRGGVYESIEDTSASGPTKSIEGWIVFVTNVHQEAQEDDILDTFSEFGQVKNINLNLDRRTGFVKGYALVEYEQREEAAEAISEMDGKEILGQPVHVNWAFVKK